MAQPHQRKTSKRRAPQGELRNLMPQARDKLHSWFREQNGTIPYREIIKRLKAEFDIRVGFSTLSLYYSEKGKEIESERGREQEGASKSTAQRIVISIDVPSGCTVEISTEERT